jgi:1-acyl-sn-glycerol-3-phosphate acyltransferase
MSYRLGQRLIPQLYHRILCTLLGIDIRTRGAPPSVRPLLVIANHASWIDVLIVSSALPAVFVAKQEVASWPIFGRLAKLQRSIFVDRGRKRQVPDVIKSIADSLIDGEAVVIFAEGTSGDGTDILPFRSALIASSREALRSAKHLREIFIQPVSLAYVGCNRRRAVWARDDEIQFIPHLLQVIRLRRIEVVLTWGDAISTDITSDRKAIAKQLERTVRRLTAHAHE